MESLILVAYATKYGSTAETARMLGEMLEREGMRTDVRPVAEVAELRSYSAVVVAAALYMGRLHKDARRFLTERREELTRMPVALMVAGPVEKEEKQFRSAEQQLDRQLARFPWLHPVAKKIVGGKWDPAKLGFPFNWTLRKVPASDGRDWDALNAWAHEIAGMLHPAVTRN